MQMNRSPKKTARRQRNGTRRDASPSRFTAENNRMAACPPLPDLKGVASATECTGILPVLPPNERPET